jgi:hypothetical protein
MGGYIYNPHLSFVIISFILIHLLNILLFHSKWIILYSKYFGYLIREPDLVHHIGIWYQSLVSNHGLWPPNHLKIRIVVEEKIISVAKYLKHRLEALSHFIEFFFFSVNSKS